MKQLTRLFIPICLETLFYMLSGMVDTLMLSAVGDYAVGAVGTANSYIGIFIIMFFYHIFRHGFGHDAEYWRRQTGSCLSGKAAWIII